VDGQPIPSLEKLQLFLENNYRVGDTVTLSLIREDRPFEVQVQLAEEPR
jgi:S1-C subfamily serine protease